jgi:hypothetical protein
MLLYVPLLQLMENQLLGLTALLRDTLVSRQHSSYSAGIDGLGSGGLRQPDGSSCHLPTSGVACTPNKQVIV